MNFNALALQRIPFPERSLHIHAIIIGSIIILAIMGMLFPVFKLDTLPALVIYGMVGGTAGGIFIFSHIFTASKLRKILNQRQQEQRDLIQNMPEIAGFLLKEQLRVSQDKSQTQLMQRERENKELKTRLNELIEKIIMVLNNIHTKIGDLNLVTRLETQNARLMDLQKQIETLRAHFLEQKNTLKEKNKEIQRINKLYQTLMIEKQQLESDLRKLTERYAQATKEKTHLEEKLNILLAEKEQQLAEKESIIQIGQRRIAILEEELQKTQPHKETQTRVTSTMLFFGHTQQPKKDKEDEEGVTTECSVAKPT